MAVSSTVLQDDSLLSKTDRLFLRLEETLTLWGGVVVFLLVFLATANILGRWLGSLLGYWIPWISSMPIPGYIDWVEQSMAFLAFLGIAYTQRQGGHIRMDMLVGKMHGRPLWITELVSVVFMLLVTLVLIYGSYLHFLRSYEIGDSSMDINLPTWPAKLVVPIALCILALRLMLQIWGYIRAAIQGGDSPVAVPLIEDPAAVAAAEAKSLMGDQS